MRKKSEDCVFFYTEVYMLKFSGSITVWFYSVPWYFA